MQIQYDRSRHGSREPKRSVNRRDGAIWVPGRDEPGVQCATALTLGLSPNSASISGLSNPQSLFGSNLAAWYRGDVTGVVVTGSGVSQWTDQSGNGRHVLQGTDAARPPFTASDARFGNRGSVNPDGAVTNPDFLKASVASSNFKFLHDGTGGSVLAVVYTLAGTTNSRVIIDTCNASGSNVGFSMFRAGTNDSNGTLTAVVAAGGGTNAIAHTTAAGTFNPGVAYVLCWTYAEGRAGTEWELRLNRNATASGNSTAAPNTGNPLDTLCVGRLTTSTLNWRGAFAELALINRALTTDEMKSFEAYALSYYAV